MKKQNPSYKDKLLAKAYQDIRSKAIGSIPAMIVVVSFVIGISIFTIVSWEEVVTGIVSGLAMCIVNLINCLFVYFGLRYSIHPLFWSFFEIKYELTTSKELTIIAVKIEHFQSARRSERDTTISKFYYKRMQVNRFKLICKDERGKKIILHFVASEKRRLLISSNLYEKKTLPCSVTYGKYSHVIWFFNNKEDDWADQFNHSF